MGWDRVQVGVLGEWVKRDSGTRVFLFSFCFLVSICSFLVFCECRWGFETRIFLVSFCFLVCFCFLVSICLLFLNQVQVGGAWVLGEWRDSGTRIGRFARQLLQHHRRHCCPSLIIVIFHQNIFKSCPTTTVVTAVCQSPLIIVIFHQTPVWGKNTLKNCSTTTATVVTDVRQSPHSLSHWKWFIIVIDL